jgi:hypothetical protein
MMKVTINTEKMTRTIRNLLAEEMGDVSCSAITENVGSYRGHIIQVTVLSPDGAEDGGFEVRPDDDTCVEVER